LEPCGEELLDALDEILALKGAADKPEPEVRSDATKTDWTVSYSREYRKLLDEKTRRLCDIYAKMETTNPLVHIRREARTWVQSARGHGACKRLHRQVHLEAQGA
jgi:hypothetical protein